MIDKEAIYDERISPLVGQIIEICKQEGIPFVMSFALREGSEDTEEIYCTSAVYGRSGMMETPTFPKALRVLRNDPDVFGIQVQNR